MERHKEHCHFEPRDGAPLWAEVLNQNLGLINILLGEIMATLDETLAKVTEEDTDIDSLIALFAGLQQQLADALSGANLPPAVQAKVDAVFAQATSSVGKVVAAIDANQAPA